MPKAPGRADAPERANGGKENDPEDVQRPGRGLGFDAIGLHAAPSMRSLETGPKAGFSVTRLIPANRADVQEKIGGKLKHNAHYQTLAGQGQKPAQRPTSDNVSYV